MEATLGRYHKAFGKDPFWAGFDFSNQNLLTIYDRFYPERPFERYDSDFFLSQTVELWKSDTEVQRIAQAANHPRDKNLATTLQRYWKAGWSGLCAFGWQHVWRIKPFLDTLGEQG